MNKIVFFDLDGTILKGISSENAFILHLFKKRIIGIKQIIDALFFIFKWFIKYKIHVFIKDKAYLSGLSFNQISALGEEFVAKYLLSKIRSELKTRVLFHQNCKDIVVLLTGSHDFLAKVFAKYLNIEKIEATECILKNNYFTNLPPKKHPFHAEKLQIAKNLCEKYGVSLKDCVAYGNSANDIILLNEVGKPIAVNPDRKLKKISQENGWEIIS